ncbi:O-methyltransferase [Lewinella sp. IMCC34183]|uniref:O-methyltransferase n=1 Tax=Lewinella sp. IMCC34183 TaxID=2248762 RepID=UPI000E221F21|nr:class I SAM-dependent methyltransferase [Lewinella sp. IMCC34183]
MRLAPRYWWFRVTSALRWYGRARTRYDVHSPFLSDFVRRVPYDDRDFHAFVRIKELRAFWRTQRQLIPLRELGAPSRTTSADRRTAASLVASNAIDDPSGRLLFRLVLWLRPDRILELGTNAGVSTLYLHLADTRIPLQTVEGNPDVAALARTSFERVGVSAALQPHTGTFEEWFTAAEKGPAAPDRLLAFLDGDHRRLPTLAYVERLLERADNESVIVVADIHWSPEMEDAWAELKSLTRVTASLDVYHFGLLFLRPELNGPHLTLIRTRWKPWRVGFF